MKPEVARRRIEAFERRFGKTHLIFACHAAFPLALTPDLLYKLWANFQRDIHGFVLGIPWVAVADLLLSSLCEEVGRELYEMDTAVRNSLLNRLKEDENFGQQRINELSDFLLVYVRQQLQSNDQEVRDFAQAQRWTALAYTRPSEAAQDLTFALARAYQQDKSEQVRIASLVKTFAEPLAEFKPLLVYAEKMSKIAPNNLEKVTTKNNQSILDDEQLWDKNWDILYFATHAPIMEEEIGNSKLIVKYIDITALRVDVVVSSDDTRLSMGGGVSRAILNVGGEEIWQEALELAPIHLGDVAITKAGKIQAHKIFHAAVLDYNRIQATTIDIIREVTKKCLKICNNLGFRSIAFPALATGAARLSSEESAFAMITEIAAYLIGCKTTVEEVTIALYPSNNLSTKDIPFRFYVLVTDLMSALKSAASLDYSQLKIVLEENNWKAADEETTKLMLRVAGREKEGYFDAVSQIYKIPGEVLRTIDSLWVNYSNARFGLSVQKRIYQSLGGTREYNRKIWEQFGESVGWRRDNKWLLYVYLDFSLNAPEGCYPAQVLRVYEAGGVWVVDEFSAALLSRSELEL
ncbi:GUN4 domain-containing protein [Microcoleus sp. EPA2]|uniref:GUN4 domain-containing protein n=1 Tax=Microcoleus sp. EPA2 TaxID=2841654 RepID=UPI00312B5D6C